ncbi:clusterin-like protein 1 [Pitangus sulphuratus]|nr:clusterin-like protein 1 [Pitangus sulphuratus]
MRQVAEPKLSEVGEKYVDEEVKKALIGIKQMKIMMEKNEDKHIDLMKTLKKSSEEKQQALRLMDEVKARLEEEERQCQVSLKNLWDECESCLESTCMRYYTTCKRGVSTFKRKVEDFLRKIPPFIFSFHEDQGKDIQFNEKPEKEDIQLVKMEDLFSQLLSDVGSIFDRSFIFFKHMQKEFDQSFQTYFMSDLDLNCPNVPELHIKFDEAFKLVNLSGEQYEQILQVVRHHTEDTSYLLTKMKERFGWVSELSNMTIGPESIFNIDKVVPGDPSSKNETVVDVNILTSPTFTIKVPPSLDPESAEFIEYVAGKALQLYKQNF